MNSARPTLTLIIATTLLGLLSSCRPKEGPGAGLPGKDGGGFVLQVVTVPVVEKPVSESVRLVGSLAANEFVDIKTETDGVVREIGFSEGQRVQQGQLLIALDDTKLAAALNQAAANLKLARANYERARQMLAEKLIPQQDYDQMASSLEVNQSNVSLMERNLKDARILAPFAGITGSRMVSPGQVISRTTPLTSLVDLETIKLEVSVPERYLGQIQSGQPLRFRVAAFAGETFEGHVYFIGPQVEADTRTVPVKARVANPALKLRGGMFASLELELKLRDKALLIPEPALISNGDKTSVFVVSADGKALPRPVVVGLRLAGRAEVLSGLSAGEQVVVEGIQKLAPGMSVKQAPPEAAAPYLSL